MIMNNLKKDLLVFKVQLLEEDIIKLCKPVASNQRGDGGGGMDCLIGVTYVGKESSGGQKYLRTVVA